MSGVFVSYRRDDTQQICSRVVAYLAETFGSDAVFFDLDKIHPGQDFLGAITQALASCEVQVLLIGPGWRRNAKRLRAPSDVVRLEVETALAGGLEVIPVLIDHAPFPKAKELPATLHSLLRRNGLQMASGPAFQADAARLVAAVQARVDAAARQHPPGPWPDDRWTALPQPVIDAVLALAQEGTEKLLGRACSEGASCGATPAAVVGSPSHPYLMLGRPIASPSPVLGVGAVCGWARKVSCFAPKACSPAGRRTPGSRRWAIEAFDQSLWTLVTRHESWSAPDATRRARAPERRLSSARAQPRYWRKTGRTTSAPATCMSHAMVGIPGGPGRSET